LLIGGEFLLPVVDVCPIEAYYHNKFNGVNEGGGRVRGRMPV
jgi:hypothetical protein